jgi:hypothetical protein
MRLDRSVALRALEASKPVRWSSLRQLQRVSRRRPAWRAMRGSPTFLGLWLRQLGKLLRHAPRFVRCENVT